jgi:hypothetical protein
VDKRIQEDNLQHLALFSEYGRMALGEQEQELESADVKTTETVMESTETNEEEVNPLYQFNDCF